MNNLLDITNVVSVIFEILIALSFFEMISNRKSIPKYIEIIIILVFMFVQSIIIVNVKEQVIVTSTFFIMVLAISMLYKLSMFKRIIFSIVFMLFFMLSEMVVGLILTMFLQIPIENLSKEILYYIQGALVSKLLMFAIIKFVGFFSVKSESKVLKYVYIPFAALPISTFLVVYIITEYTYKSEDEKLLTMSVVASIFLIVANVLVFYLFEYQLKITEIQKEEQMLKHQLEIKAQYYKELSRRQQITNKTMHDLKNQLFALHEIYKNNPKEGMEKIEVICADILSAYTLKFTGIESIDALITSKLLIMKENNIKFFNNIYISKDYNVDIMDMCILLGNLLDNAIEANNEVNEENRFVNLLILQQRDYVSINISNPTGKKFNLNKGMTSTKKHKELHGFGLKSVNEIVGKYDGNCILKQEDGNFEVLIMLKDK
ncbi:MAG: GHKL domain-containing protein [Lachnospiraceae bacterium]|nr:GHKL domain-containing protein [Lachnospiraceae bacterium]